MPTVTHSAIVIADPPIYSAGGVVTFNISYTYNDSLGISQTISSSSADAQLAAVIAADVAIDAANAGTAAASHAGHAGILR